MARTLLTVTIGVYDDSHLRELSQRLADLQKEFAKLTAKSQAPLTRRLNKVTAQIDETRLQIMDRSDPLNAKQFRSR